MSFQELSAWLDAHVDEMIELQRILTAAPALGPEHNGHGEWKKSNLLEAYLGQHVFPAAVHCDTPDERVPERTRPNFIVYLQGDSDRPRLWIMSHMDVVPPGEQREDGTWVGWQSDPYTVRRDGDRLYGRGVEDNQQAIVASVFAGRALLENAVKPARTVALLYVSAEETGSIFGLKEVLSSHPDLFAPDDLILVPDGGNPEGSMIEVAEKSVLWLTFHVKGRQSHGSMPHKGCNAFRAAARLICGLDKGLRKRFDAPAEMYDSPCSTFEPTMHDKNVPNINTIPAEETFAFDCRILPQFNLDAVLDYVRKEMRRVDKAIGTETTYTVVNRVDAPPPTSADAPLVHMLKKAVKDVYGIEGKPMGIGGSTVAVFFREARRPAVVWSKTNSTAHQANESCDIPNMVGDAKAFAHLAIQPLP